MSDVKWEDFSEDKILHSPEKISIAPEEHIRLEQEMLKFFQEETDDQKQSGEGDAAADAGALKPQRQLKPDLSEKNLEEYIEKLLQKDGRALAHFLGLLKENRIAAGSLKKLVNIMVKKRHPRLQAVLSRILDAVPGHALKLAVDKAIKLYDKALHRALHEPTPKQAHQPPSPFQDPSKTPECKKE